MTVMVPTSDMAVFMWLVGGGLWGVGVRRSWRLARNNCKLWWQTGEGGTALICGQFNSE